MRLLQVSRRPSRSDRAEDSVTLATPKCQWPRWVPHRLPMSPGPSLPYPPRPLEPPQSLSGASPLSPRPVPGPAGLACLGRAALSWLAVPCAVRPLRSPRRLLLSTAPPRAESRGSPSLPSPLPWRPRPVPSCPATHLSSSSPAARGGVQWLAPFHPVQQRVHSPEPQHRTPQTPPPPPAAHGAGVAAPAPTSVRH